MEPPRTISSAEVGGGPGIAFTPSVTRLPANQPENSFASEVRTGTYKTVKQTRGQTNQSASCLERTMT